MSRPKQPRRKLRLFPNAPSVKELLEWVIKMSKDFFVTIASWLLLILFWPLLLPLYLWFQKRYLGRTVKMWLAGTQAERPPMPKWMQFDD